jgi:hypothetical protein
MPSQNSGTWLRFSFALTVMMSLTGCLHRPLVNNKNLQQPSTVDPSVYTVEEYNKDKEKYDAETDLTVKKLKRSDITWGLMTDIEIVYNSRYQKLFGGKNLTAVVGDGLTLGLGSAGAIATNAATKTIFAALNTGFSGLNLSISKNYYAEQSFQVIGIAMQTRRDKIRAGIVAGLAQDVATYPLNQAKRDLITYIQAGTLAAGLQELQEEAGVATAAVKTVVPTAPPSAPLSPSPNVGILQNALTWSAVTGASSYTVYWGIARGVTKSSNKLDPVTVNDLVHSGLDSANTYYYAITASNAAGESDLSTEVSAQPIAMPTAASPTLPAPTNLRVQMVGSAAVITFDAPSGAATFDVYKDATSTATRTNRIFTGKSTNLYVDTASNASKSFYSIIAVDINGTAGSQSAAKQASPTGVSTTPPLTAPYQLH